MANQVRVTSLDALDSFRASLIIFLTKARRSVDEVGDELRRTRLWIQHDQRLRWEGEFRRRSRVLDQAEGELMSARLSGLRETSQMQQAAVLKAKRALAEAEEKLRYVKVWNRDYEGFADPFAKRLQTLRQYLDHDLPAAITYLVQAVRTLETYTEAFRADPPPPPATEEKP
ncbi:MAG: hypothetical protein QOE70_6141 [Chthoniobacter sp.]|jgi:hypothetical protein|nr:hypothetical protein [Chthoniobacter sp.]